MVGSWPVHNTSSSQIVLLEWPPYDSPFVGIAAGLKKKKPHYLPIGGILQVNLVYKRVRCHVIISIDYMQFNLVSTWCHYVSLERFLDRAVCKNFKNGFQFRTYHHYIAKILKMKSKWLRRRVIHSHFQLATFQQQSFEQCTPCTDTCQLYGLWS